MGLLCPEEAEEAAVHLLAFRDSPVTLAQTPLLQVGEITGERQEETAAQVESRQIMIPG